MIETIKTFWAKWYKLIFILSAGIFVSLLAVYLTSNRSGKRGTFPADTRIVAAKGDFAYENKINDFHSQFKAKPTDADSIVFTNALGTISFYTPVKQSFGDITSGETPVANGSTLTYPNIFPQMDLRYTVSTSRLLEEFIVKDVATAKLVTKIEQRAKTDSTYVENEDGSITFTKDGKEVFTLPHPVMYEVDNTNEKSLGINYEIKKDGDQLIITKVINSAGKAWLADTNRKYPIAIDLVIDNADALSTNDVSIDNGDSSGNWTSSDGTNSPVSQETTIQQEGSGSVKITSTTEIAASTVDLMEYSSDGTAQTAYVVNDLTSATGGTITTSGGYTIHKFTGSGSFVASNNLITDTLAVGGGGGSADSCCSVGGGGGGGGAVVSSSAFSVSSGTYPVTVGAGGITGAASGNTIFSSITATGGGSGAGSGNGTGGNGASGGGSAGANRAAGTGTQGFNGGIGFGTYGAQDTGGGGGGGAGGAGGNATGILSPGGGGGGVSNSFSGSAVTYGAGGAGGRSTVSAAVSGGANTGNGASGGNSAGGANGGSGIVIIRYLIPLQSFSEATTKTQGTYALKGVANQNTSLNKTLTRTIGSPLDLSNRTSVTFDIRSTRTGSNIKVGIHDTGGTTTEVTPNITSANAFQTGTIDLSGVSNANKDAIDQVIITIVNADSANTFYIDNMLANSTASLGDTITRTTNSTDLSSVANLTYWVRSSVAGSFATFGFGESAATEQTNAITINQANTWEQKTWDITQLSAASRNAVTKFAFTFTSNTNGALFYFDDIRSVDLSNTWISSDSTNSPVSLENTIKQEGSGSVKIQTGNDTASPTIDLMEYSSNANAQAAFVAANAYQILGTGGTITTSGTDRIHSFTTSGTFTSSLGSGNVQALVVAGGGAGGNGVTNVSHGSGGGGGTVIYNSAYAITAQAYTTTVGLAKNNSAFGTITATAGTTPTDSSMTGGNNANYSGGTAVDIYGGGGAGGGQNGGIRNGGNGYQSSITGTVTYYGGGGAGGSGGTGGQGGGGDTGVSGGTNTGGGGGGAYLSHGEGGSGKVIIRYPMIDLQSFSEGTIKTQGTYSLKGYAEATTGLNKTLTRTIGSPLDLSNRTSATFDIRSTRTSSNIKVGIHDAGGTTTEVTPNITSANVFQSVTLDLSGVTNANKDAIDQIIITVVNADAANTFYIDNMIANPSIFTTGDTITRTTTPTDLSGEANITYWVHSSVAGSFATFGFGEAAATEQTNAITISQANTWEQKQWDISALSAASRNAVTKFAFTFTSNTSGASFYFDDIQTNTLYAPTIGTASGLSSSSIRWAFTDGATGEDGFKVYDGSNVLMATCSSADLTYCDESGLSANTSYTRKVTSYSGTYFSGYSSTASKYTLAALPSAPTVSNRAATTVNVNPNPATNPAGTLMAIYRETGTTCDGSGGVYLAANGSSNGATAVWQSDATWATVTATGLSAEQTYTFCVKAKNGDNVETNFSSSGTFEDTGLIPISGSYTFTGTGPKNTNTFINRYVDGDNPSRYVIGVDDGSGTNGAVFEVRSGALTLNATDTLVVGSLNLTGGSIAIANGAVIKIGQSLWMVDADSDGYSSNNKIYIGSAPANGRRKNLATTLSTVDCDETNASYNNQAIVTYYRDIDGDGQGASANGTSATCATTPGGYVANNTDCYDANPATTNAELAYVGSGTCSTANRGDGSYDYNCSTTSTACSTQHYATASYQYIVKNAQGDCAWGNPQFVTGTAGGSSCGAGGWTQSNFQCYGNASCSQACIFNLLASGTQACQ